MFPQYGLFLNSSFDLVEAFKGRNIGMTNNENTVISLNWKSGRKRMAENIEK